MSEEQGGYKVGSPADVVLQKYNVVMSATRGGQHINVAADDLRRLVTEFEAARAALAIERERFTGLVTECRDLRAALDKLTTQRDALRDVLEQVEWSDSHRCPVCAGWGAPYASISPYGDGVFSGHTRGCKLDAALRQAREEGESG